MPRVVHVTNSSSNFNLNTKGSDVDVHTCNMDAIFEEPSDDDVNRNYNQKDSDSTTTLRFNINYSLYNVTYNPNENEIYCLKCNIGGTEFKFKKDARVWLHKSSSGVKQNCTDNGVNKEKRERGVVFGGGVVPKHSESSTDTSIVSKTDDNPLTMDSIDSIEENFQSMFSRREPAELDSDISSFGDPDASLTYSEETTPSHSFSATPEKSPAAKTSSDNSRLEEFDLEFDRPDALWRNDEMYLSLITSDVGKETHNASRNNNYSHPAAYDIARKLAPAIVMEKESLENSLIDNLRHVQERECVAANTRYRKKQRCGDNDKARKNNVPYKVVKATKRKSPQLNKSKILQAVEKLPCGKKKANKTGMVYKNLTDIDSNHGPAWKSPESEYITSSKSPNCGSKN